MKIDKEYLAKHHFWFLLAAYTPMVLLALILLWTSVAGAIEDAAKAIKKSKDEVKQFAKADAKNEAWIRGFKEKADKLAKKKNDVWGEVWQGQSALFTWPDPVGELNSYEYGEDIREARKRDVYVNDKDSYPKQVKDLIAIVQPVNDKGEGVVQYQGGWKQVLTYVPRWLGAADKVSLPSSEDLWLAQEDLWVQRELLQVIRDTNDGLALYEKSKHPPERRRDENDRQVFENPRWRLELGLTRDANVRWRVTNRSPRLQTLALTFRLTFKGKVMHDLWVDGEPLAPNQSSKEITVKLPGAPPSGIDAVTQVLDWHTAPVKRIDKLKLGYVSASTSGKQLVPFPKFAPKEDPNAAPAAPAGGMQGVNPGPGGMMPPGPGDRPGMMGERGGVRGGNELGLERNRYLETSEQVRRMPIGMVFIVDQAHIQDVLTSFAKSRLRFQVTQVEWKRYRGSIQPAVIEDGKVEGEVGPGMRRRRPPMAPPNAVRPAPMPRPGKDPAADQPEDDEDSSNLVELGLYGIASLYMKYPPKAAADAAAARRLHRLRLPPRPCRPPPSRAHADQAITETKSRIEAGRKLKAESRVESRKEELLSCPS